MLDEAGQPFRRIGSKTAEAEDVGERNDGGGLRHGKLHSTSREEQI